MKEQSFRRRWWESLFERMYHGPVSGRYRGKSGAGILELRVDVDPRSPSSPVTGKVSGDLFRVARGQRHPRFVQSWRMDNPLVSWSHRSVRISGSTRYRGLKSVHRTARLGIAEIEIPWLPNGHVGPAAVILHPRNGRVSTFQCRRVSDHFRHLVVEVDIAESARRRPILPKYDTASLENRPSDLQRRILRIQDAYTDAGILVTFPRRHDIVPDSAEKFETWSDYELFDAMMDYFNARDAPEPGWAVWGFLAGRHDVDDVLGIMFDAWPNRRKNRQGFAIFGGNPYFAALAGGESRKRAEASRAYLFTWVHEIGHALGLYHWNE